MMVVALGGSIIPGFHRATAAISFANSYFKVLGSIVSTATACKAALAVLRFSMRIRPRLKQKCNLGRGGRNGKPGKAKENHEIVEPASHKPQVENNRFWSQVLP